MDFDIDRFRIGRLDEELYEADLWAILDCYQSEFFSDVLNPIKEVLFIPPFDGPARVLPEVHRIEISENLRNFPKICCLMVLHELMNNKLFWEHGAEQTCSERAYQDEVRRMLENGAFNGLL